MLPVDSDTSLISRTSDRLFALYLWSCLAFLCGVGTASLLSGWQVAALSGIGLVSIPVLIILLRALSKIAAGTVVIVIAYALFMLLPIVVISDGLSNRIVLFDLYYVVLVATATFLKIWSWRVQAFVSLFTFFATSWWFSPLGYSAARPIALVFTASLLSFLAMTLRRHELFAGDIERDQKQQELLMRAIHRRFPQYVWNVFFLLAGLLGVLLIFDLSLSEEQFFRPFTIKMYGFVVLIIASVFFKLASRVMYEPLTAVTILSIGGIVSLSGVVSGIEASYIFAVFPTLYIVGMSSVLPWSLYWRLLVGWGLVAVDVFMKCIPIALKVGVGPEVLTNVFLTHRIELSLLLITTYSLVLISRQFEYYRIQTTEQLFQFPANPFADENDNADAGNTVDVVALVRSDDEFEEASRLRAVKILFVAAFISLAFSSVIMVFGEFYDRIFASLGLLSSITLWPFLFSVHERKRALRHFWILAAAVGIVFVVWFSLALLLVSHIRALWLLWPVIVYLTLGSIPWRVREILPISIVAVAVGTELIAYMSLGPEGVALYTIAFIFSLYQTLRLRIRFKGTVFTSCATQ